MHRTRSERSRSSWVTGRLTWPVKSTPTFFRAVTEFGLADSPVRLATPPETTFRERRGSGCAARACCRSAVASGLRQMFPVQTTRMCPGSGIGRSVGMIRPKRQNRYWTRPRGRSGLPQGEKAPVQLDRPLEHRVDERGGRGGLVRRHVGRLAVRNVLLLEVRLVDPRLRGIVAKERFDGRPLLQGVVRAPVHVGRDANGDVRAQAGRGRGEHEQARRAVSTNRPGGPFPGSEARSEGLVAAFSRTK